MNHFVHGGDIFTAEKQIGRPAESFLDYSANINPFGMPEGVKNAIINSIDGAWRYPDPHYRALANKLAERERVDADWIRCSNGAADLIYRAVYGCRPKTALILAPTFAEYEAALDAAGCKASYFTLKAETGFSITVDFLDRLEEKPDMVFLCNPNNPTGVLADRELMGRIARTCQRKGIRLFVDECFLDFVQDGERESVKALLEECDKLIILKAFTKLYAMAGVRLGYCLSSDGAFLDLLDRSGPPWSVSHLAQAAGIAALDEKKYVRESVRYVQEQREYMKQALSALGLSVAESKANYLFFSSRKGGLEQYLQDQGILVRSCANYRGLPSPPFYYRAAVKQEKENRALLDAMGKFYLTKQSRV